MPGKKTHAEEPADHALGRSQGGFGTKVHLVTDSQGTPLAVVLTPGQRHETQAFEDLLEAVPLREQHGWPEWLAGDKGYNAGAIREWLAARGIGDVIPTFVNQRRREDFDRQRYRRRNIVERCIGWLKECRRIATRFEKLAIRFMAMLKLAMIRQYMKLRLSDTA